MIMDALNAVAPDWNLKIYALMILAASNGNAVAPDWNLKLMAAMRYTKGDLMQSHQIGI